MFFVHNGIHIRIASLLLKFAVLDDLIHIQDARVLHERHASYCGFDEIVQISNFTLKA